MEQPFLYTGFQVSGLLFLVNLNPDIQNFEYFSIITALIHYICASHGRKECYENDVNSLW